MSLGMLITIHELGVPFGKPRKGSKVCYYFFGLTQGKELGKNTFPTIKI